MNDAVPIATSVFSPNFFASRPISPPWIVATITPMKRKKYARSSGLNPKRSRACSVTLVSMPATASRAMKSVDMIARSIVRDAMARHTRGSNWGGTALRTVASGCFDSPRTRSATSSAVSDSDPATMPGSRLPAMPCFDPTCASAPESGGPRMKPMPNAAPMRPMPLARSSCVVVSAMYACAVPMFPPPAPAITREANSRVRLRENAKRKYPRQLAVRLMRITGRRPMRSESRPHTGAKKNCMIE